MSKDTQRPTDSMTAADALRLMEEIKKTLREEIQKVNARMANIQGAMITMSQIMESLSTDLSETRVKRREEELFEVDQEEEILQKRLNIVLAKKEMKAKETPPAQDTNERFKKLAVTTYLDQERTEQEQRAEVWKKRRETIVTAILVTTSVGAVGAILTALGWFILFYITNR